MEKKEDLTTWLTVEERKKNLVEEAEATSSTVEDLLRLKIEQSFGPDKERYFLPADPGFLWQSYLDNTVEEPLGHWHMRQLLTSGFEAQGVFCNRTLTLKVLFRSKTSLARNHLSIASQTGVNITMDRGTFPELLMTVRGGHEKVHYAFDVICEAIAQDKVANQGSTPFWSNPSFLLSLVVPQQMVPYLNGYRNCNYYRFRSLDIWPFPCMVTLPNSTEVEFGIYGDAECLSLGIRYICSLLMLHTVADEAIIPYKPMKHDVRAKTSVQQKAAAKAKA